LQRSAFDDGGLWLAERFISFCWRLGWQATIFTDCNHIRCGSGAHGGNWRGVMTTGHKDATVHLNETTPVVSLNKAHSCLSADGRHARDSFWALVFAGQQLLMSAER